MKFCSHCGAQLDDNAIFCSKCGSPVSSGSGIPMQEAQERPNAGFSVLSFFFPLVGLILYIVWMNSHPVWSKGCGKWALIGFIVNIAVSVVSGILWGVFFSSMLGGLLF